MSTTDTEYLRVWQQVQQWPAERRRSLADQIRQSLPNDPGTPPGEWTEAKNARRCQLIDKEIQETLSEMEKQELEMLTQQLRAYRRRVAPLPIHGARQLHQQLLEKQRGQAKPGSEET